MKNSDRLSHGLVLQEFISIYIAQSIEAIVATVNIAEVVSLTWQFYIIS